MFLCWSQAIGKPIEARNSEQRKSNPLSKSVWVSGFHPETNIDELEDYIVQNTTITEKTKFKCSKLVKKDQDITKMSFVSFKIDVLPEDFDVLNNPDIWPQRITVREFIRMTPPKPTLENFLPASSANLSTPERNSKVKKTDDSSGTTAKTSEIDVDGQNANVMEIEDDSSLNPNPNDNKNGTLPQKIA